MSVTAVLDEVGNALTISVEGRFGYAIHDDFEAAYRQLDRQLASVTLDFTRTEYIDSAALGMLLMLREELGGDQANVSIVGANDVISRVLQIANFNKLFELK